MRWMIAAAAVAVAALTIAGCGGGNSPAPPTPVVGSYLGDAFTTTGGNTELVANIGFVVRANGTVEGAAFTSAPVAEYDIFFTGAVDGAKQLQASGGMIGGNGTQDAGSFTMTGAVGASSGYDATGTFTADNVGAGTWGALFRRTANPIGCYMGAYTGDRSGIIAIMNFALDDTVVMTKEAEAFHSDYFAAANILTPPVQPGGDYGLRADDSFYNTGLVIIGALNNLSASGTWSQPQNSTPLTGAWAADRPDSRAATRAVTTGPLRVRRVKHNSRSSPVAGHS